MLSHQSFTVDLKFSNVSRTETDQNQILRPTFSSMHSISPPPLPATAYFIFFFREEKRYKIPLAHHAYQGSQKPSNYEGKKSSSGNGAATTQSNLPGTKTRGPPNQPMASDSPHARERKVKTSHLRKNIVGVAQPAYIRHAKPQTKERVILMSA